MNSGGGRRESTRENDIPGRENSKSKVMASQKYSLFKGCQGNMIMWIQNRVHWRNS